MPQPRRRRPAGGNADQRYIFKSYGHRVVVSRVPVFTLPWSPRQTAHRERLAAASRYAVSVQTDPAAVAFYEEVVRRQRRHGRWTVRNAAISDFFAPPQVSAVRVTGKRDAPGATLTFSVTKSYGDPEVRVGWRPRGGKLRPLAVVKRGVRGWWHAFAEPLPEGTAWELVVTAVDRPGHTATAVLPASAIKWQ